MPPALVPFASATWRGVLYGAGAALFWAIGFVAARQGVATGLSPLVIALYRFIGPGMVLLPMLARSNLRHLGGLGWRRGIALAVFGGLPQAALSYAGFLLVPLGHGAIIQPSCASLGGLALASLVLKEALPGRRIIGALAMVLGLAAIGTEALTTMGKHGLTGDFLFVVAGFSFAVFGMFLRLWRIPPKAAAAIVSVLSLAGLPIFFWQMGGVLAAGAYENIMQAAVQGVLAGVGAIYLFTRAVVLLGASRAALFPSLVPPFTLFLGFLALGEVPSAAQLAGLAVILIGFRLTQHGA
jgi:drug/metabolite transporter (DMT)-like permease